MKIFVASVRLRDMQVGLLSQFSGSRVPGIEIRTDQVIEEPEPKNPVPVPVLMFS